MIVTVKNDKLILGVDTLGAQMMHLQDAKGTEYLWQGDPAYWQDRSPVLFPFIGRLTENSYYLQGVKYPMTIHGFAAQQEFAVVEEGDGFVVLELTGNDSTKQQYPFDFSLKIGYRLEENRLNVTYQVENRSEQVMPFGIGGHPGFNVPFVAGERFEDYELVFSTPCQPQRLGFSPAVYLNGQDENYPLQDGTTIAMRHELFDEDAIILRNMARAVTLRSKVSGKSLCVSYPDMPYLGIWHWPHTDAPYVCIEPWTSLPARQDVIEELTCKSDMIQLKPGCTHTTGWEVTIE